MGHGGRLDPGLPVQLSVLGEVYCRKDGEVGGSVTRVCKRSPLALEMSILHPGHSPPRDPPSRPPESVLLLIPPTPATQPPASTSPSGESCTDPVDLSADAHHHQTPCSASSSGEVVSLRPLHFYLFDSHPRPQLGIEVAWSH